MWAYKTSFILIHKHLNSSWFNLLDTCIAINGTNTHWWKFGVFLLSSFLCEFLCCNYWGLKIEHKTYIQFFYTLLDLELDNCFYLTAALMDLTSLWRIQNTQARTFSGTFLQLYNTLVYSTFNLLNSLLQFLLHSHCCLFHSCMYVHLVALK